MEGEKTIIVGKQSIKCVGYYGYNSHYYVTLFDDTNNECEYLTQLDDCQISDDDLVERVKEILI